MKLVGPFDVLGGLFDESNIGDDDNNLLHCRHFYDPPEMQTFAVIDKSTTKSKSSYHLGYFRDTPDETNPVVVSNDPQKSCHITGIGDNIFTAILFELSKSKSSKTKSLECKLKSFAESKEIPVNSTKLLKQRKKVCNAGTFHKFGLKIKTVNDVGYRELPETDETLMRLFQKIIDLDDDDQRRTCASMHKIHRIMTLINYANDEMDFGMGLEFGIDLFCTGHQFFHKSSMHLLSQAYELLERDTFSKIIKIHLNNRKQI